MLCWLVPVLDSRLYLLTLGFMLSACADYHPETLPEPNAMKPGSGLFSGDKGDFILYESDESVPCECPTPSENS